MQDAVRVGVGEAARHLVRDAQGLVERQGPLLEPSGQRLPAQELHDEVRPGRASAHVVKGDDVGVVELRDRLGLLLDPLGRELATRAVRAQGLERHVAPQLRIEGLVDRTEAPPPDLGPDLETTDPGSGMELFLPGGHDLVGRGQRDLLEQPRERAGAVRTGFPVVALPVGLVGHVDASASGSRRSLATIDVGGHVRASDGRPTLGARARPEGSDQTATPFARRPPSPRSP